MDKSTQIISGIYKILNTKNNKIYIGSSINIEKRFGEHLRALKGSYHNNNHLQSAWNKYGKSNFIFTIIETCSIKNLVEIEQFWMDYYNVTNDIKGYNITPRADRTVMSERTKTKISKANKGNKHTKEAIQRMSVTQQKRAQAPNYTPPMEGKKHTKEAKEKISEVHKGKIISDETKLKMSKAQKGRKFTEETKTKISSAKKGYKHSKETKRKMSIAAQNRSEETKQNMSIAAQKKFQNPDYINPNKGRKLSDETKEKMSVAYQKRIKDPNYINPNKSSKHSNETKAKQS